MQINVLLENRREWMIPINYQHQLQSAIYRKLGEVNLSDFWHNMGFGDTNKFKAFLFTPLTGDVRRAGDKLIFSGDISFTLRSPKFEFCDSFQRALENNPSVKLFDTVFNVQSAALSNIHLQSGSVVFKSISPVVVHKRNEDWKRIYLSPVEDEFTAMLKRNISRKYEAFFNATAPEFSLAPVGSHTRINTLYKSACVTGYKGLYAVNGPYDLLELIYNAGLGTKNAEGFGVMDIATVNGE